MPTLTALYTLSEIRPLIYKSFERRLTGEERDDLARLCELMPTISGRDDINQSADEFRLLKLIAANLDLRSKLMNHRRDDPADAWRAFLRNGGGEL